MNSKNGTKPEDFKGSKWAWVAMQYNSFSKSEALPGKLRNKWNKMNLEKKESRLLRNSSGMGAKGNMMNPQVFAEFLLLHPNAKATDKSDEEEVATNCPSLNNNGSCISSNATLTPFLESHFEKKTAKPRKKPKIEEERFSPFQSKILSYLDKDSETSSNVNAETECYKRSILILNEMGLEDEGYIAAVDILLENRNALKVLTIPEDKRKSFLNKKIHN